MARLLENQGFRIIEASDGKEALEHLQVQTFAAVFTDLEMPRCNGLELLREIKSDPRTHDLTVVVASSRDETELQDQARELGALAWLVKPVNETTLRETLESLKC
jgi:CheY-like chemotaxis protein